MKIRFSTGAFFAVAFILFGLFSCRDPLVSLASLPDDYSLTDAKADNCVVFEDGDITAGQTSWDDFEKNCRSGKKSSVRLAYYYTLGDKEKYDPALYEEIKDDYPVLHMAEVVYDGKKYSYYSIEDGTLYRSSYAYMKKYEGNPRSESAVFSDYTYYVLVNDDFVTWEDIEHGMFSAVLGDWVNHKRIYSDLVYK